MNFLVDSTLVVICSYPLVNPNQTLTHLSVSLSGI